MQQIIVWEGDTAHGHFQIVDGTYDGRVSRVIYSGGGRAAQSGVARDDRPGLLFDYNQRFLELADGLRPRTVLIIGGGVGTLASALLAALPEVRVDLVEPDAALTDLGQRFFGLPGESERLRITHTDGRNFLRQNAARYDLIVVDAFVHTTIPRGLQTLEAFAAYHAHLKAPGALAMNVISGYYGPAAQTLRQLYAAARRTFAAADVFLAGRGYSLWLPQNFVLTAQRGPAQLLQEHTRGELVSPPRVQPEHDTLHD